MCTLQIVGLQQFRNKRGDALFASRIAKGRSVNPHNAFGQPSVQLRFAPTLWRNGRAVSSEIAGVNLARTSQTDCKEGMSDFRGLFAWRERYRVHVSIINSYRKTSLRRYLI